MTSPNILSQTWTKETKRRSKMYGVHLYWERDADGSWFFVIGKELVDGFLTESAVIRAGLKRLKELEQEKMEELELELMDVDRSIEKLLMAPQHIGENQMGDWELEDLRNRHKELKDLLEYPPIRERL